MHLFRLAALLCVASALAFLVTARPASAAACNATDSVKHSAILANNTADGGHVKQHVLDETPPAGTTQNGKTLFAGKANYDAAWRQYTYYGSVNCGVGAVANQTMTLTQLHMTSLSAYSCTAVNASGKCTAKNLYGTHSVTYGFIQRAGHWILNTCYPIPLTAALPGGK